jgi:hypothetical protein
MIGALAGRFSQHQGRVELEKILLLNGSIASLGRSADRKQGALLHQVTHLAVAMLVPLLHSRSVPQEKRGSAND